MNKEIRKHIKHVTSSSHLKKRFNKCDIYFKESTHIEFDRLGFEDSTWHHDGSPSFRVTSENECRVIQCFMGEDNWSYTYFKRFQLCIDDEYIFDCEELIEMYGFIKSNLDLLKSLANGDDKKREIQKHNNELDDIIETLEEISEFIGVDIFDMDWNNDEEEDEDKKDFALYSMSRAINAIKKERK